ncbi:MAG: HAMP domain-containing histidine kinase [candidate division KSB1 bacterium]|nr:HAMP domain-containing histidine kinase [candidate division KSB1 bacterium]
MSRGREVETAEELRVRLEELCRNFHVSLDLIPKAVSPEELIDRVLDEYISRFEEIPGEDVLSLHEGKGGLTEREKLRSLLMFSAQAVLLHENARVYRQLEEAYRELRVRSEELAKANDELRRLNAHYLSMLGFVSHELRSPLVSLLGFAELLDEGILGELTEGQREAVQIIARVARKLIEMTRNYLDLAKIENGRMPLRRTPVDLEAEVLRPIVGELEEQLRARRMRVERESDSLESTPDLWADGELMAVVVQNLFSNAIRYGREGTAIRYAIRDEGDHYHVTVFNEGEGVHRDQLSTIFGKFVDIPKKETRERGSGLGLYNTRCIVESHGGRIWAESEYGKYFCVHFTLPKGEPEVAEGHVHLVEDHPSAQVNTVSRLEEYSALHSRG